MITAIINKVFRKKRVVLTPEVKVQVAQEKVQKTLGAFVAMRDDVVEAITTLQEAIHENQKVIDQAQEVNEKASTELAANIALKEQLEKFIPSK